MKKRIVAVLIIGVLMALMMGALTACGGSGSGSAASASDSAASASSEASEDATVHGKGYTAVLPEGFTTEKDDYYTNGTGSFYVVVGTKSAQELLETETADGDYKQGADVVAGDLTFMVAESDKWPDKTYYIAPWEEDHCIEVTVSRIDDPEVIKAFLSSIKLAK